MDRLTASGHAPSPRPSPRKRGEGAEALCQMQLPGPLAAEAGAVREFWASFRANHGAVAGVAVIATVVLLAAFADLIAPHSPVLNDNTAFLKPPFWQDGGALTYLLGTDAIGR